MADFTSAGTIVAAVMETAGYVTQAHILADFQEFFSSAGAFLYILGAMGGIISWMLFGSFRMARYLLVAPAFFWLLVGTTSDTYGVERKLGGGTGQHVNDFLTGRLSVMKPSGAIPISTVFELFTGTINAVVNSMVDMIVAYEDDRSILFVSRTQAFETLINAQIANPTLMGVFHNNMMSSCSDVMNISLELAEPGLTNNMILNMQQMAADPNLPTAVRNEYVKKLAANSARTGRLNTEFFNAKNKDVKLNKETLEFVMAHQHKPGAAQALVNSLPGSTITASQDITIKCGQLWDITTQAIMEQAQEIWEGIEDKTLGDNNTQPNRDLLCKEMSRKLGRQHVDGYACDLPQVAAIFLIRNALSADSANWRQEHLNNKAKNFNLLKSPRSGQMLFGDESGDNIGDTDYVLKNPHNPSYSYRKQDDGQAELLVEVVKKDDPDGETKFVPYFELGQVFGHRGVIEGHLAYQTRGYRQKIFTWAMSIPYYQGVLLYLIAVGYPFIAFVVVMPGRASAILMLPLAWLWIKSWDIGFALVMVLDDVLWNMFPQHDFAADVDASGTEVFDVMKTAFAADPAFNVHGYYMFLSMSLLAIPGITGYATLKSKASILASFTRAPDEGSEDARDRGDGALGVQIMADKVHGMRNIGGAAYLSKAGNIMASGGAEAAAWGAARGGAKALRAWSGNRGGPQVTPGALPTKPGSEFGQAAAAKAFKSGGGQYVGDAGQAAAANKRNKAGQKADMKQAMLKGANTGLGVFGDMAVQIAQTKGVVARYEDKTLGRFGSLRMMMDATTATVDAEGAYEMNDYEQWNVFEKELDLKISRMKHSIEITRDLAAVGKDIFTKGGTKTGPRGWRDMAVGMLPTLYAAAEHLAPEQVHKLREELEKAGDVVGKTISDNLGWESFQPLSPEYQGARYNYGNANTVNDGDKSQGFKYLGRL